MADEIAVDSFLDLLGQSELVSDAQLLALTAEFLGEGTRPASAHELADELVKREILTTWQADKLLQRQASRLPARTLPHPQTPGPGGHEQGVPGRARDDAPLLGDQGSARKYQEDADLLNRFHLEARAVAALDHPNIVRAYDFNKDDRHWERDSLSGDGVRRRLDLRRMVEEQGPLDCRKAADFICQAADGLAHAHAAGFVHRDIKPANLLVDPHGVLKILDLGLATFDLRGGTELVRGRRASGGRHGRLRRPRAGDRQPQRQRPRRHLQPWADVLLPVDRAPAFLEADDHGSADGAPERRSPSRSASFVPTCRWTWRRSSTR